MKLNDNYEKLLQNFFDTLEDAQSTNEQRQAAFAEMMNAQQAEIQNRTHDEMQALMNASKRVNNFSNKEMKFYNAETLSTTNVEKTLPVESIERIFDDLITNHELLRELGVQNAMLRIKVVTVDPTNVSNWGKVTEAIKGKILSQFDEKDINQAKLTAYAVIPKDILEYGPTFVYQYISKQLEETLAAALEKGFVVGTGNHESDHPQPIGLAQQKATPQTQKTDTGTLTFKDSKTTINELGAVMAKLSLNEDGTERTNIDKVLMIVNTAELWKVKALFTIQNASGEYITNVPFGIKLIPSAAAPKGKAIFAVPNYYDAFVGGGLDVRTYDQTLAMEDALLMTGKMFAYGEPRDENVSLVYALPSGVEAFSMEEPKTRGKKSE